MMKANSQVIFKIPDHLQVEELINKTAECFHLQPLEQSSGTKTFYDSFDWRLYKAELVCEFNQSTEGITSLNLISYINRQLILSVNLTEVPRFIAEAGDSLLTEQLQPVLEMRALLPVVSLNLQTYQYNCLNRQQKTVAKITIEKYAGLKNRLILQTLTNNNKTVTRLQQFFTADLGLKPATKPLLDCALKIQGRRAGDYSSKLNIKLEPTLSAQQAVVTIYKQLLQFLKCNEQGVIEAIDSEFLHDFRVAVRRTRAGLNQLKAVLPADVNERYREYFAWLGEITTLPRDLDVYLLNFNQYQNSLSPAMQPYLQPLHAFLKVKQDSAQKKLVRQLKYKKYRDNLTAWESYLNQLATPSNGQEDLTIKPLADVRIWKVYRQILKKGSAITKQSLPVELHELRKTCKKLRYLIEFFQSLYPPEKIKSLLKSLKELQEILGDFQDSAVQQQTLQLFSKEMRKNGYEEQTFLAIAELVQVIENKSCQARCRFAECFASFASVENKHLFKSLFANKTAQRLLKKPCDESVKINA